MKTTLILLFATSSLFGQVVSPSTEGPVYNHAGQKIAYKYADGTRESYAYDSAGWIAFFVDRAGRVTQFSPPAAGGTFKSESTTASTNRAPDSTLFTTYNMNTTRTNVSWVVCGSTQLSEGCFSSGNLGPFGNVGALLEGNASVNQTTNTVTRSIYVVDVASGSNGRGVTLYVYTKTDMVTTSFDTVNVTLSNTLSLPLRGGAGGVHASMAANNNFLFVGTNQSPVAVEIRKANFAVSQISGFDPPINVSAITTDPYGYVTITFGSFANFDNGFVVIGPNGSEQEDGGGADFMLNAQSGVLSFTLQ